MAKNNQQNLDKNRKSGAQEIFDQADNAGRFAGNDADAKAARSAAEENIKQDTASSRDERGGNRDSTDAEARRDRAQSHDYKEEAQNVNDDWGRPLTEGETEHARNKSMEGTRQNRDTTDSGTNDKVTK